MKKFLSHHTKSFVPDINQTPPTIDRVHQERIIAEKEMSDLKQKAFQFSTAIITLAILPLWGFQIYNIVSTKTAIMLSIAITIGALFFIATSVGKMEAANAFVVNTVATGVSMTVGVIIYAGNIPGAYIITLYALFFFFCICYFHIDLLFYGLSENIESLHTIGEPDFMYLCPDVLEACKKNKQCDDYRLAVAGLDRCLTVSEANMITRMEPDSFVKKAKRCMHGVTFQEKC
jgi:hypothetical protein